MLPNSFYSLAIDFIIGKCSSVSRLDNKTDSDCEKKYMQIPYWRFSTPVRHSEVIFHEKLWTLRSYLQDSKWLRLWKTIKPSSVKYAILFYLVFSSCYLTPARKIRTRESSRALGTDKDSRLLISVSFVVLKKNSSTPRML